MNFTVEQFLNVFERYNEALWPMQIVAYAVGIALVVLALTKWKRASAVIFGALAVMWAGMAVGYMWILLRRHQPRRLRCSAPSSSPRRCCWPSWR